MRRCDAPVAGRHRVRRGSAPRSRSRRACRGTATPLPVSTPASASNFFRRATSASDESASFAARRASFASSTAAWRFCRLASKRDFHEPASLRAATSAQRSSSQRASAASARARSRSARTRSRSYSDWKSRGGRAVPVEGKDQSPLALSVDLRSVEKSSSRMTMHTTIAHGETCYQPPCGRLFHAESGCSTVGVSTARRNLYRQSRPAAQENLTTCCQGVDSRDQKNFGNLHNSISHCFYAEILMTSLHTNFGNAGHDSSWRRRACRCRVNLHEYLI